jgi:hypothetical protein
MLTRLVPASPRIDVKGHNPDVVVWTETNKSTSGAAAEGRSVELGSLGYGTNPFARNASGAEWSL